MHGFDLIGMIAVIFTFVMLIFVMWIVVESWKQERGRTRKRQVFEQRFESQWPVLTDQEFLAACKPGTSPEVALAVRRIVADQLGIPYERTHPDQDFVADLNAD